jgi:hypothetical protein
MARKRSAGKAAGREYEALETGLRAPSGSDGFLGTVRGFFSGFLDQVLQMVKFFLGLCLLPLVYCATAGFLTVFQGIESSLRLDFWAGAVTLVVLHLFIWEPEVLYQRGQRIVEFLFKFAQPFLKVAPSLLPIHTILIFLAFGAVSVFQKSLWPARYAFFFAGFSVALHLVYSARSVQTRKSDFLKAHYLFTFSLVYLVTLIILAGLINIWFKEFSFLRFLSISSRQAADIFSAVFRQIFL